MTDLQLNIAQNSFENPQQKAIRSFAFYAEFIASIDFDDGWKSVVMPQLLGYLDTLSETLDGDKVQIITDTTQELVHISLSIPLNTHGSFETGMQISKALQQDFYCSPVFQSLWWDRVDPKSPLPTQMKEVHEDEYISHRLKIQSHIAQILKIQQELEASELRLKNLQISWLNQSATWTWISYIKDENNLEKQLIDRELERISLLRQQIPVLLSRLEETIHYEYLNMSQRNHVSEANYYFSAKNFTQEELDASIAQEQDRYKELEQKIALLESRFDSIIIQPQNGVPKVADTIKEEINQPEDSVGIHEEWIQETQLVISDDIVRDTFINNIFPKIQEVMRSKGPLTQKELSKRLGETTKKLHTDIALRWLDCTLMCGLINTEFKIEDQHKWKPYWIEMWIYIKPSLPNDWKAEENEWRYFSETITLFENSLWKWTHEAIEKLTQKFLSYPYDFSSIESVDYDMSTLEFPHIEKIIKNSFKEESDTAIATLNYRKSKFFDDAYKHIVSELWYLQKTIVKGILRYKHPFHLDLITSYEDLKKIFFHLKEASILENKQEHDSYSPYDFRHIMIWESYQLHSFSSKDIDIQHDDGDDFISSSDRKTINIKAKKWNFYSNNKKWRLKLSWPNGEIIFGWVIKKEKKTGLFSRIPSWYYLHYSEIKNFRVLGGILKNFPDNFEITNSYKDQVIIKNTDTDVRFMISVMWEILWEKNNYIPKIRPVFTPIDMSGKLLKDELKVIKNIFKEALQDWDQANQETMDHLNKIAEDVIRKRDEEKRNLK